MKFMVFTQQVFYSYIYFSLLYITESAYPTTSPYSSLVLSIPFQIKIVLHDFFWEISNKLLNTGQIIYYRKVQILELIKSLEFFSRLLIRGYLLECGHLKGS